MKRLISVILLLSVVLSFTSCKKTPKDISCDNLVKAYTDAGYSVSHYHYGEAEENENYCLVQVLEKEGDDESDFVYFDFYLTPEAAEAKAEEYTYNIGVWLFALPFGEYRWLTSEAYGNIHYHCYNTSMLKPFRQLQK